MFGHDSDGVDGETVVEAPPAFGLVDVPDGMEGGGLISLHCGFDGVKGVLEGEAEKGSAGAEESRFEEEGVAFKVEVRRRDYHR